MANLENKKQDITQENDSTPKYSKKTRTIVTICAGLILFSIIYLIIRFFGPQFSTLYHMLKRGDEQEIGTFLNRQGRWKGLLSLYMISILQVVSIVIPGIAIQIAGGLIYGGWRSFLMCYTGFVSGNVLVFIFGRKIGNRLLDIIGFANKENWLTTKINTNNPTFVIGMACLVPGVPNGIIPYIAARTAISTKEFAAAIACSSWIQILCNCVAGHYIIRGNWVVTCLAFGLQIALIVIVSCKREAVMKWLNLELPNMNQHEQNTK